GRKRKNPLEHGFVEVGNTNLERSEHAGPIGFYEAVLTEICLEICPHHSVHPEARAVTPSSALPRFEIVLDLGCRMIVSPQKLPQVFAKHWKTTVVYPCKLDSFIRLESFPVDALHATRSPCGFSQCRCKPRQKRQPGVTMATVEIFRISAKDFIPAIAGERHLDVLSCHA